MTRTGTRFKRPGSDVWEWEEHAEEDGRFVSNFPAEVGTVFRDRFGAVGRVCGYTVDDDGNRWASYETIEMAADQRGR